MFTVKYQRKVAQAPTTLTGQESKWQITEITGLDQPDAQINTKKIAGLDGSIFDNAILGNRNIVINMKINGDADTNRHTLYDLFRVKEQGTFFFKTETRDLQIDCYVEKVTCTLFAQNEMIQISLICTQPAFLENLVRTSTIAPSGETTIANSNQEIGLYITVAAVDDQDAETTLGFHKIVITSASSFGTYEIILNADDVYAEGSVIAINTKQGLKSVVYTAPRQTPIGIFSNVDISSVFFPLYPGDNDISYIIDDNADNNSKANVTVYYNYEYEGV